MPHPCNDRGQWAGNMSKAPILASDLAKFVLSLTQNIIKGSLCIVVVVVLPDPFQGTSPLRNVKSQMQLKVVA